jgi:mandelamide amidase
LGSWTIGSWDEGFIPISYAVTTLGPMGRTVADVALLHSVVTGTPKPAAVPLRGVRIGVPRGYYWEDLDPEVARVAERVLEKLRSAGAILIDIDLSQWAHSADPVFFALGLMHSLKDVRDFLLTNAPGVNVNDVVAGLMSRDIAARVQAEINNPISAHDAHESKKTRVKLALQFEQSMQAKNLAAIIYPTIPVLAPLIRPGGDDLTDTIELNGKQVGQFSISSRNTHLSSVVGTPSLSLPGGLSSSGLPIGISLDGLEGSDNTILGLGLSLEVLLGRLPIPTFRNAS